MAFFSSYQEKKLIDNISLISEIRYSKLIFYLIITFPLGFAITQKTAGAKNLWTTTKLRKFQP